MIVKIKNLRAHTIVGVHAEEQTAPRALTLNIFLEYNHDKAVETDSIEHAIDYALIEDAVVASLAQKRFNLIESVAQHICELLFADERTLEVTVEVEKPGVMRFAEMVSVIHTMRRE